MFGPVGYIVGAGLTVQLRAGRGILHYAERSGLRVIDASLNSAFAQEVATIALRGPLIDAVARECVRLQVVERAMEPFLDGDAVERLLATAEAADAPQRVVDQLLTAGVVDAVAERIATGPELERIVAAAIDTPAARRLVTHVIESGVVDEATTRLLESEELWLMVDEIASSPAVTDAISHQSAGLADQVAGVVRDRSRTADARLERVARRVLRRPRGVSVSDTPAPPQPG
jgi:hypothetical protein